MSLFTRPKVESRSIAFHDVWGSGEPWAKDLSPGDAVRLTVVRACVGLRSRLLGQLPFAAYREGAAGLERVVPQPTLIASPSSALMRPVWLAQMSISLDLWGNAYGLIVSRDRLGYPTQITWLDPWLVAVTESVPGAKPAYTYNGRAVDATDIAHLATFVPPGSVVGLAPLEKNGLVELGRLAQEYGRRWFKEGAHPSVILRPPATPDIGEAGAAKLKSMWKKAVGRGGGVGVLSKSVDIERIQTAPNESQFLETTRANQVDICMAFGVPPEMIGVANAGQSITYANRDQRLADLMVTSLNFDLAVFQEFLSAQLPRPQLVKFNTGALLRSDLTTRYGAHAIGLNPEKPFLTLNEVRRMEELGTVEGGDVLPTGNPQSTPTRREHSDA